MPTSHDARSALTPCPRPSSVARALKPVWLLSALAVGAVLLLASPPAPAQATDSTPTITVRANPSRVAESDDPIRITVTATASVAVSSDVVVSVNVGWSTDTAVRGSDYTRVDGVSVTIASGDTSGTGTFNLSGTNDNLAGEGSEYITIFGSRISGFNMLGSLLYITDGDSIPSSIILSVNPNKVKEGDRATRVAVTASFPASSNVVSTSNTTVSVTVGKASDSASSGSDYKQVNGFNVVIAAGSSSGSATFDLTVINDILAGEGNETITLTSSSSFTIVDTSITIEDNDVAPTTINLGVEGNGVESKTKSITASASFPAGSAVLLTNTIVTLTFSNGSATSGVDFEALSSLTLTIGAGQSSGEQSFSLVGLEDSIVEGGETIIVSGISTGFTINGSHITILDNDIILTIDTKASTDGNQTVVQENVGSATISVTASVASSSNRPSRDIVIPILIGKEGDTADKGANKDYTVTSSSPSITIRSGQSTGTVNVTLNINDDKDNEHDEEITYVGNTTGFFIEDVKMTIEDNDIILKVTPGSVSEPDGTVDLKIEAILPQDHTATSEIDITISVGKTGDSATSGSDYTAVDDFSLRIPTGQRIGSANVDFVLLNDGRPNSPKNVTIQGSFKDSDTINASRYDIGDVTLTINSLPRIWLDFFVYTFLGPGEGRHNIRHTAIEENSTGTLRAVIRTRAGHGVGYGVQYLPISFGGSATNTVDYSVGGVVVPFTQHVDFVPFTTVDFPFALIDDSIAEGSEKIIISGSLDGYYIGSDVFTIEDNEVVPTIINLNVDTDDSTTDVDSEVMEGSTADVKKDVRVTASFPANSAPLPTDTVVSVTVTAAGNATAEDSDFSTDQDNDQFTITIPAGSTSGSEKFVLTVKNDNVANEGDETVIVSGSVSGFTVNPTSFEITGDADVAPNTVSLTLEKEDEESEGDEPTYVVVNSIGEDSGTTEIYVTASFTGANVLETDTKITLTVSGGSATLGSTEDFTYSTGSGQGRIFDVVIPAESESSERANFALTVIDDRIYEAGGSETILVSGSASGFTVNNSTLNIVDNEIADLSENKCNAGVGNFITDSTKSDLIEDCKVLVVLRNLWSPNLSDNHPLRKWGVGTNLSITSWSGVTIENDRVAKLLLPGDDNIGRIDAQIPYRFRNLVGLEEIDLSDNNISGNLYSTTTLTNLVELDLSDNNLDNAIPSLTSWGNNLENLDLSNNALTGTIFGTMSMLSSLESLDLSDNRLTGVIPGDLRRLSSLESLDLSDNSLNGVIPGSLGNLSNLESLDLSGNRLTGVIPGNLSMLSSLESLDLSDNILERVIPGSLGILSSLEVLDLSGNDLDGVIPGNLRRLSNLENLDLSDNGLTGVIPGDLNLLSSLEILDLSGNNLTGVIPDKFGDLSSLESLDISNNLLTGNIPRRLDRLVSTTPNTGLQEFRFCGNNLTGSLSTSMRGLGNKLDLPNPSTNYGDISVCRRSIDLSVETSSVSENSGTTEISVFATLTGYGATGFSPLPDADLVVTILIESGTADIASGTITNDFTTNKLSGGQHQLSLTIPKGSSRSSAKFDLIVVNDSVTENDETVKITAEAEGYAINDTEVEITDDD